jgi:tellurite resistance protein TerC
MTPKRIARIVGGFALLLAGAAMMVLPGPGIITIALGLAVLARDFEWAQRMLDRLKKAYADVRDKVTGHQAKRGST